MSLTTGRLAESVEPLMSVAFAASAQSVESNINDVFFMMFLFAGFKSKQQEHSNSQVEFHYNGKKNIKV